MKRDFYYGCCANLNDEERLPLLRLSSADGMPAAARLRAARDTAAPSISRPKLAGLIGTDRTTIWRMESGLIETISRPLLEAWAAACGVNAAWLADGTGPAWSDEPTTSSANAGITFYVREIARSERLI